MRWFTALFAVSSLCAGASEPWKPAELMPPATLAATLRGGGAKPLILFVGFPVLYKGAHIPGAMMVGPGEKGVEAIQAALAKTPKSQAIVIYCGCCPMDRCPNIRPAFQAVKQMGFEKVKLLEIPVNMNTDWTTKGYPTEKPAAGL